MRSEAYLALAEDAVKGMKTLTLVKAWALAKERKERKVGRRQTRQRSQGPSAGEGNEGPGVDEGT